MPRATLPELLTGVKEIGQKYNFRTVCYGHAGDGNLHVNILKDNLTNEEWETEIPLQEAEKLLAICENGTIDKSRHEVKVGNHIYEVDIFEGDNIARLAERAAVKFHWQCSVDKIKLYLVSIDRARFVEFGDEPEGIQDDALFSGDKLDAVGITDGSFLLAKIACTL